MFLNLLAETEGAGNNLGTYIVFGVLLVVIIGLFVWQSISGKKKQKEAQDMVDGIKVGDRVKTIGGVCGFIVEINNKENTFVLETGTDDKKSYVKFDKGAIYQTAPAEGAKVATEKAEKEQKEEPAPEKVEEVVEEAVVEAPAEETEKEPKAE